MILKTQIIDAIYENGILKPLEPLNIEENTKVRIIIEPEMPESHCSYNSIMKEIRKRQLTRGYKSPAREDVDSYLQAERDGWEK